MGTLEDVFNLPETLNEIEEKANQVTKAFEEDQDSTEIDHLLSEFNNSLSTDDMANIADLKKYDEEMDQISEKTLAEFEDLMTLGKDVEVRHAGEIFSAAAQMAKIALDAKTNKTNAKLKILELSLRRKRNDLLEQKQNHEFGNTEPDENEAKVLTRDQLIEMAEMLKKDQKE